MTERYAPEAVIRSFLAVLARSSGSGPSELGGLVGRDSLEPAERRVPREALIGLYVDVVDA